MWFFLDPISCQSAPAIATSSGDCVTFDRWRLIKAGLADYRRGAAP